MGIWDVGPFDNDDALDGLEDLKDTGLSSWLDDVYDEYKNEKHIESGIGSSIVAVSAIIVGFRNKEWEKTEQRSWDLFAARVTRKEVRRLKKLLKIVLTNKNKSELYTLIAETDALPEWKSIGNNILKQLY